MFDANVFCQSLLQFKNFRPHDVLAVGQDGPHPIVNLRFVAPVLFFAVNEFHFDVPRERAFNRWPRQFQSVMNVGLESFKMRVSDDWRSGFSDS
jgi:hypothetical protein